MSRREAQESGKNRAKAEGTLGMKARSSMRPRSANAWEVLTFARPRRTNGAPPALQGSRMRVLLASLAALSICACATVTPPPAAKVTYTGTPQEQWVQGQKAYEAWSAARPGWKVTASGLQYRVVKKVRGDAPRPTAESTVTIHYVGRFIDGREFDSSRKRGEPATFPLPRLIKGWQEGVPMMKVGETWEFVIPSTIAYGERNRDPIPPGSTLLFEIELIGLEE